MVLTVRYCFINLCFAFHLCFINFTDIILDYFCSVDRFVMIVESSNFTIMHNFHNNFAYFCVDSCFDYSIRFYLFYAYLKFIHYSILIAL